eukprot:5094-Heterococcus_DN1.PRE.7
MYLTLRACWLLLFCVALLIAEVAALRVVTASKHAQPLSRRAAISTSASKAAKSAVLAAATSAMLLVGTRADAAEPDSKDSYDKFAAKYDQLDGGRLAEGLGLEQLRRSMTATAAGRVLEIAVGTGLNLSNYNRAKITKLDCIDLSSAMLQQASLKSAALDIRDIVQFHQMDAEHLSFSSGIFDTVVDTFSLSFDVRLDQAVSRFNAAMVTDHWQGCMLLVRALPLNLSMT